jgi:hypothetical protein
MNKVQLDAALSAERIQRAEEDRTGSVLNLIKAAQEIQGVDIEQVERVVNIGKNLGEFGQKFQQTQQPQAYIK